jgi:hypothetical protein
MEVIQNEIAMARGFIERAEDRHVALFLMVASLMHNIRDKEIIKKIVSILSDDSDCPTEKVQSASKQGCVRTNWRGWLYVADDTRIGLAYLMHQEMGPEITTAIRILIERHLGELAKKRANNPSSSSQLDISELRQLEYEIMAQRLLIPNKFELGVGDWQRLLAESQGKDSLLRTLGCLRTEARILLAV